MSDNNIHERNPEEQGVVANNPAPAAPALCSDADHPSTADANPDSR